MRRADGREALEPLRRAEHRPHVTLVQRFVRTAELEQVYAPPPDTMYVLNPFARRYANTSRIG
ncbi:MAG: hypothetical protein JST54_32290 [Deltaproteobacteria bacterium]|nr:hypothetical protein [Deltaproteobacteria bacterium]